MNLPPKSEARDAWGRLILTGESAAGIGMGRFLRRVLPPEGHGWYVLASEFQRWSPPGPGTRSQPLTWRDPSTGEVHPVATVKHRTFDTLADLEIALGNRDGADAARKDDRALRPSETLNRNVWFAIASYRDRTEERIGAADGKVYEQFSRKAENVAFLKCLPLDLDVKPHDPGKGYASQEAALLELRRFLLATGLSAPEVVLSSGNGIHVYWVLEAPVTRAEWQAGADRLKDLTKDFGLKSDPSVTADAARYLRPVGTSNWKDPLNPRPVKVLRWVE